MPRWMGSHRPIHSRDVQGLHREACALADPSFWNALLPSFSSHNSSLMVTLYSFTRFPCLRGKATIGDGLCICLQLLLQTRPERKPLKSRGPVSPCPAVGQDCGTLQALYRRLSN